MVDSIEYKELTLDDINIDLLNNFERFQEIRKSWRIVNGTWALIDDVYTINMDKNTKQKETKYFSNTIKKGGFIFGAYENKEIVGYSALLNERFGTRKQYIELKLLHISSNYRGKGIGKKLFFLCVTKAKELGIEKIYISSNSSEETVGFYMRIGCTDAMEINSKIADEKPYDRQMEYTV